MKKKYKFQVTDIFGKIDEITITYSERQKRWCYQIPGYMAMFDTLPEAKRQINKNFRFIKEIKKIDFEKGI